MGHTVQSIDAALTVSFQFSGFEGYRLLQKQLYMYLQSRKTAIKFYIPYLFRTEKTQATLNNFKLTSLT